MSNKQLKSIIRDSWDLEESLLYLLKQCFERIYGDKAHYALSTVESDIETYNEHKYLSSLNSIDKDYAEREETIRKYNEERNPDEQR